MSDLFYEHENNCSKYYWVVGIEILIYFGIEVLMFFLYFILACPRA